MSILLIVITVTLIFFLPVACFSIYLSMYYSYKPSASPNSSHVQTFRRSWNLLFQKYSIYQSYLKVIRNDIYDIPPKLYKRSKATQTDQECCNDGTNTVECRVCLCEIEEGEEVREVSRCKHMFHNHCLDAWAGTGSMTCPICRGSLAQPPIIDENGHELVIFQFSSLCASRTRSSREHNWWLR